LAESIGIIDCGTNTFHLMIVSIEVGGAEVIFKEKIAVKIGEGGINNKIISPEAIKRALDTLNYFSTIINQYRVKKILGFATSAFRNAENGISLSNQIKENTGIEIKIISGEKEAELIFKGVNNALKIGVEPALVMDIGGGSVEFIIGASDKIYWKRSFEIGAQRLVDLFHKSDPIRNEEVIELHSYFESQLEDLFNAIKIWDPKTLIGSSGTFDTLSDMFCLKNGIPIDDNATETPLTIDFYHIIHAELIAKNRAQRMEIPGMIELRADMIVVASELVNFLLNKFSFNNIRVSTHALKEGVLAEILKS
jgi:exopolyphosphatase/guanosine-5'-triphosphate,3'-diphosphate pyrophosphatase